MLQAELRLEQCEGVSRQEGGTTRATELKRHRERPTRT
jgi:hypothetical protein